MLKEKTIHEEGNDYNEDFLKVGDMISKHKANIQRYAQKFNVQIKFDENASCQSSMTSQKFEQQQNLKNEISMDEFDTQKFKSKLGQISESFNKFKQTSEQQQEQEQKQQSKQENQINSNQNVDKENFYDEIKKKYLSNKGNTYQQQQNETEQEESGSEASWKQTVKQIKQQQQSQKDSKSINFKSILQKYSNNKFDYDSSESTDKEYENVKPRTSNSPRVDSQYEKIKNKYLNRNLPQKKQEEEVRKSAEELNDISQSQAEFMRSSKDTVRTSIDDLLSNLKNRFSSNRQSKNKQYQEDNNDYNTHFEKENQQKMKTQQQFQERSNQKDIVSKEENTLNKSLELLDNKENLTIDKFVHTDQIPVKEQTQIQGNEEISNKDSIDISYDQIKSSDQESQDSEQYPYQHNQQENQQQRQLCTEKQQEQEYTGNNATQEEQQQQINSQQSNEEQLVRQDKQNQYISTPQKSNRNTKVFQMPTKLTPYKNKNKQQLAIPKYNEFQQTSLADMEQEEQQNYQQEFSEIQNTLKAIKQMNLIQSPEKDLNELVQEELQASASKQSDINQTDQNQEIDYELTSSDEEEHQFDEQQQQQDNKQRMIQQKQEQELKVNAQIYRENLSDISFESSSNHPSIMESQKNTKRMDYTFERDSDINSIKEDENKAYNKQQVFEQFIDEEIKHLINLVPLAEQKLRTNSVNKQKQDEIKQSLMKVNYLVERLRYLNNMQ